jgi:hypothetical protein
MHIQTLKRHSTLLRLIILPFSLQKLLNTLVNENMDPENKTYSQVSLTTKAGVVSAFMEVYPGMYKDEQHLEEKLKEMMKNKKGYRSMSPTKRKNKIKNSQGKVDEKRKVCRVFGARSLNYDRPSQRSC